MVFLEDNRHRIEVRYGQLAKELPQVFSFVNEQLEDCGDNVALAVKYLYAAMPYSDVGNYPLGTFLDYAAHGVRLYEEHEEVRALPEELFLNYVLYHRVNEEEITPCRSSFYEKLRSRIIGRTRKVAALEVNYWCAEEAAYQCTDDRTLSAMAVYMRGNGRCGEESVFSVNAMRSAGIPARQVYAPRWSHCDDNHAWVEIWCDGIWYFTGACEPVPILNNGWFTNAASRAMLIHSRWFDFVPSGEDAIGTSGMVTMLNQTRRYAAVKRVTVCITDEGGNKAEGAEVSFEVLNYAEFAPVASCITDEKGIVSLTAGLGSLHIHAHKGKKCADCFLDTRKSDYICVTLESGSDGMWHPYDMIAPVDTPVNTDMPAKEQVKEGSLRLANAARMRRKKTEGWSNPERAAFLKAGLEGVPAKADTRELREELLLVLTEKDQTDLKRDILEEHLNGALPFRGNYPENVFLRYVMNPRADDEILSAYRRCISGMFTSGEKERFCESPAEIWEWVDKHITPCPQKERDSLITTPEACMKLGAGSILSKKVLFVAIGRTLGIPARLHPHDRSLEYWKDGSFVPVMKSSEKNCRLYLTSEDGVAWNYFQNWSIARQVQGRYVSLKLGEEKWEGQGLPLRGTEERREDQRLSLTLEPGYYRILTTNRLPNGNQFLNQYKFSIEGGSEKQIKLELRQANLEDMLENIDLPDFTLYNRDGSQIAASVLSEGAVKVFMWLEESKEPTEHILNELLDRTEEFRQYAQQLRFVIRNKEALSDPTIAKTLKAFGSAQIYYDDFLGNVSTLGRRVYVDHEKLPLIIVTDGSLNGIYATSGYNVGTGDMLLRLFEIQSVH